APVPAENDSALSDDRQIALSGSCRRTGYGRARSGADAISFRLAGDRGLSHAQVTRRLGLRAVALECLSEDLGLRRAKRLSQFAILVLARGAGRRGLQSPGSVIGEIGRFDDLGRSEK